jgi:anaerobic C4-dicarboxylate transporter DcuA
MLATVVIVILAACPQLRPDLMPQPNEYQDIIIICMLSAACLMVVLCKTSTDAIVLTSTFRAGMSSLAVILGLLHWERPSLMPT